MSIMIISGTGDDSPGAAVGVTLSMFTEKHLTQHNGYRAYCMSATFAPLILVILVHTDKSCIWITVPGINMHSAQYQVFMISNQYIL